MNSKNILDHFIELTDPREDNKRHEQEIINIDGKTLCRSHGKGKSAIHMVSAWANKAGLTIGQVKVDDKSNEITAIPELLQA